MVSIDFVEIPLNHFLCYGQIQGFECVLHQSPELLYVNQVIFLALLSHLFCLYCTFSEEVGELHTSKNTY